MSIFCFSGQTLYSALLLGVSMASQQQARAFQRKVFSYYTKHKRPLPWRKTTNPYHILLSEIMLQQTQVERVIHYYGKWLRKWPTVGRLAKASRVNVLKAWLGLGYNNRAKNLHQTAKIISEKYKGDVLKAMEHYKELPGIGPYTAAAVQIFAANRGIATVDTNIRRILLHEFALSEKISDKKLWALAEKCLPKGKSREWHNALMDYGATLMTARKTGIKPKTQQPKFEGSDRQIRAKIIRKIVGRKKASFDSLMRLADEDAPRLKKIIEKMVEERLLKKSGHVYALSER